MAKSTGTTVIKKYANRRLYNTGTSSYVTLDDLAKMVRAGEDFSVLDARTGEDITHAALTQIIFEQETRNGHTLLSAPFMRQLISCYGNRMQTVVPGFLEHAMKAFAEQQNRAGGQVSRAFGEKALAAGGASNAFVEEQARSIAETFQPAYSGFKAPPREARRADMHDIEDLKAQFRSLQERIDSL